MNKEIKAYCCYCGSPCDGTLLVYAETANKARYITSINGTWEWDYPDITAQREKDYDKYYNGISTIEDNDELPKGAMPFYADDIY